MLAKQIIYRSSHRGCKETDFLLGNFFADKLDSFPEKELPLVRDFLEEDDLKIYDWILSKEKTPEIYLKLVAEIQKFHNIE